MKLLQNLKSRLMIWTINKLFITYFGTFYYPFESANNKFMRMKDEERMIHMNSIYNFVESKAYRIEFQEVIRTIYTELATKPYNDISVSAYRMALIFFKDFDKRLKEIHKEYKQKYG
jgi:hypothetical protein